MHTYTGTNTTKCPRLGESLVKYIVESETAYFLKAIFLPDLPYKITLVGETCVQVNIYLKILKNIFFYISELNKTNKCSKVWSQIFFFKLHFYPARKH